MLLNDQSHQSMKHCLSICNDIETIFSDLFKLLGIHGISFYRIYQSEERIFMSNSPKWIENYFEHNYFSTQTYNNNMNLGPYNLWITWPQHDTQTKKIIKDAFNNFDYGNSLYITRAENNYIDVFVLRGFARDNDVNNRYFIHLDTINAYIDYFLLIYQKSIKNAENFKIIITKSINEISANSSMEHSFNSENTINRDILIDKVLDPKTGMPFLSKRETECLKYLVRGRTNKQIARELSLSHRTVEEYIKNIKSKMGLESKSEIIDEILSFTPNKKVLMN